MARFRAWARAGRGCCWYGFRVSDRDINRHQLIESAAGVAAGARTGLSNVAVAGLFLLAMFCSPLAAAIPGYATAPALILVGVLMSQSIAQWSGAISARLCRLLSLCWPHPLPSASPRPEPRSDLIYSGEDRGGKIRDINTADMDSHPTVHSALCVSGGRLATRACCVWSSRPGGCTILLSF